jgi:2-oxo-hept-3-ene-1,7-dioate hydratase
MLGAAAADREAAMKRRWTLGMVGLLALAPAGGAAAACATDAEVAAFAASFLARTPAAALGAGGDLADARCTQEKLVATLSQTMGPVVGFKAGLTSTPAQERFGATEPVLGVLYRDMMLEDGAEVPAAFGAAPLFEADLILVVGDAGVNDATTPAEVMAHVAEVRPFIELPDLALAPGEPMTAATITAMGVGARLGVLGAALPVEDPQAMADALEAMTVTVRAADGTVMAEAPGGAVLGHPANAALWLRSQGIAFAPGDLISVGSFGPLLPPAEAGGRASVTYAALPGDPVVSVVFAE